MDAFGIFEGGGAKGLAHVGALKVAEQQKVNFVGVAGTSAGAIIAALIAAGYHADELYNPNVADPARKGVLNTDLWTFFDKDTWTAIMQLRMDATQMFGGLDVFRTSKPKILYRLLCFYRKHKMILDRLMRDRGLLNTDMFVNWIEQQLQQKVRPTGFGHKVMFKDINAPLKIIASHISDKSIQVFSRERTPDVCVADAVASSISIPFVFKPKELAGQELVDGGLLSNFPAWVFDSERRSQPTIPTFGFTLQEIRRPKPEATRSIFTFANDLFSTVLEGEKWLGVRLVENLYVLPLQVSVGTLDFDLTPEQKDRLYRDGEGSASIFFLSYPRLSSGGSVP